MEELSIPLPGLVAAPVEGATTAESTTSVDLDLRALGPPDGGFQQVLSEGMRVEYLAEVTDAMDQVGSSRTYLLTVVSEEDLVRMIQDDLGALRESLDETLGLQRKARRELERIQDDARLAGGRVAAEDVVELRQSRLDTQKVGVRLDDNDELLSEIIQRVEMNRLTDVKELPWILGLQEALREITEGEMPAALARLEALEERAREGAATPEEVGGAAELLRRNEQEISKILAELKEWGDLRTIVRKLEELLRTEQELERKVQEKVRSTLGE